MTADDDVAHGDSFDPDHRVLGLFADGIAGRSMHLQPTTDGERAGWPWDADVAPDGETVHLPAAVADRLARRAAVLHQAGYVEFGTADVDVAERDAAFAATHHPGLLLRLFTILEDVRVDAAVRHRYPGARRDLDALAATVRIERSTERPVMQRDDLVDALRQYSIGAAPADLLAAALSPGRAMLLAELLRRAGRLRAVGATADDSIRIALEIGELVDEELPFDPEATFAVVDAPDDARELERPGDEPRSGDVPRPPSSDMEQGDELTRLGGQIVELMAPDPGEPEPERPEGRRPTDLIFPPSDDLHGARAFRYDEWNYHDRRYLRSWCRVLEQRLHGEDASFIGDVRRRHAVLASRVRRQFSFVRPEGWVRVHHADDGDELDIDAVIEAVVDRRTGTVPDDNVHIRRERAARDVATAFLVDLSASTSSPVVDEDEEVTAVTEQDVLEYRFASYDPYDMPPPPEPSRRVLDVAKESVALMCDALEVLGDRHAVYGFSGESREHVDFHVAKEFDDRTSPSSWAAIAAMKSLRYTRMGPAVRHATAKLAAQPSRTKLLIVISDGYPQDIDYGPVRGDNEYGLQDTARALREAIDAGVHPYCVTIDPAGHDYLRRMCPPDSYVVIDDVPSLPRELATLYRAVAVNG